MGLAINLLLNIIINQTGDDTNPIKTLRIKFDEWKKQQKR